MVTELLKNRIIKYLLVGGTAAICEYLTFLGLIAGHLNAQMAQVVSFLLGLVISFTLNKQWTFVTEEFHKKVYIQLMLYLGLAATNAFISYFAIEFLISGLSLKPAIAKLMMMALIAVWNYTIFKNLIFVSKDEKLN